MTKLILALLLFNTITNVLILFRAYRGRLKLEWVTTFWYKYKYGFRIMLWDESHTTGHTVFHLNFISPNIARARDDEEFKRCHASRVRH